ncbi:MAG TPA: hypothetical protein VGH33_06905 [Isosphaeraceae bacterium]
MVRELVKQLVHCLRADTWPGMAAIVDFGIDTPQHLGALQYALVHGGRTPAEFDAALGSGRALTALCAVPGQPYPVTFDTDWDHMGPEED